MRDFPPFAVYFPIVQIGMAPADAGADLVKIRPQANPRGWKKIPAAGRHAGAFLHPHPRILGGFRVPAGVTTYIIKMHKFVNLNS